MINTVVRPSTSQALAALAAEAASGKQAEDLLILDVRTVSGVTDYFVIGTAGSRRQMAAITEEVEDVFKRAGKSVWHVEGLEDSAASRRPASREEDAAWVLMDCGEVIVHLFSPSARQLYQLERLWADAPRQSFDSE